MSKENANYFISLSGTEVDFSGIATDNVPEVDIGDDILEEKLSIADYKVMHGEEIHIFEQLDNLLHISKTLTDSGLIITKLNEEGQNLEDYYLEKVGERHD